MRLRFYDRIPAISEIARDAAPAVRIASEKDASRLTAAERLQIFLAHRDRMFASQFDANENEAYGLKLLNAMYKEFYGC